MKSNTTLVTVLIIVSIAGWYLGSGEEWTLLACKEKLNDAECYSNSYVIPGFKAEKECMLEGVARFSKEGFECGRNCEDKGSGLRVCEKICNSAGCGVPER